MDAEGRPAMLRFMVSVAPPRPPLNTRSLESRVANTDESKPNGHTRVKEATASGNLAAIPYQSFRLREAKWARSMPNRRKTATIRSSTGVSICVVMLPPADAATSV